MSTTTWSSWSGLAQGRPTRVVRPTSPAEVAEAVLAARAEGLRVKMPGNGHSFTDIALTDGVLLDPSALTGLVDVDREAMTVDLVATTDVLSEAAAMRREGQTIVGFAAEHGPEGVERARGKLERKKLDAIVVNDISRPDIGFDSDQNEVVILGGAGELHVPRSSKEEVAVRVLDFVQDLRAAPHQRQKGKR